MKKGFTLIEIIIALLVLTVGIVAAIGLLGTTLDSSAKSHNDLEAAAFAEMVFSYYNAVPDWSEIPPEGTWSIPDYNGNTVDLTSGQYDTGSQPLSFELVSNQPAANIKSLSLRIWPGYNTNGPAQTFYAEIYNWTKN